MPVTLNVIEDGYVLHYAIADPLEAADLMDMYSKEKAYRDNTPHVMHSITDMTGVRRIPKNWLQLRAGPGLSHPRSGEMILYGLAPGIEVILNTILKIAHAKRVRIFRDQAEAWRYVRALAAQAKAKDQVATAAR